MGSINPALATQTALMMFLVILLVINHSRGGF
jgi:hypothetical protein